MHAVYPSRRFLPAKTRAMIDYLAQEFDRDPRLSDRAGP
jgi:DNA-binding transcriptional LysR family regulator